MQTTRTWDIFCKVIDNFGDIGVCWRLACDLSERGQQVRLWVDDASALAWMAPDGAPGVQVRAWTNATPALGVDPPGDVVIEAFGCEVNAAWIAHTSGANYGSTHWSSGQFDTLNPISQPSQRQPPVWINLEYLSAEPYVANSHGLPSPVMSGPARGMMKWFFYPGFTVDTGGLLRGAEVAQRLAATSLHATESISVSASGPAQLPGISTVTHPLKISLFCYEPPALEPLLNQLAHTQQPTELLVTAGRATQLVRQVITHKNKLQPLWNERKQLSIAYQALMPQNEFDDLLRRCDLNFVRGEDSLVRALWAGKSFVWQIYPQSDRAHAAKLNAFLDWLEAPPDLRLFHHVWNGLSTAALPSVDLPAWTSVVRAAQERLLQQTDLTTQLMAFVQSK
jgi:uncharacterized repeat protein (TIGR03837 family)